MYIYIRSMSEAQSKVYDILTASSDQIIRHIAKIMLYPDSPYVDHWMHEIWSFLFRVDKLKGKNKWPKASFIQKSLSTHNDTIEVYIPLAIDDEDEATPTVDISTSELLQAVQSYIEWISLELSAHGYVRQNEVKEKLFEICNLN